MAAARVSISKFNMKSIVFGPGDASKGPVIILIGRRGTGKSFMINDILYHNRDIPICTIICPTDEIHGFYSAKVPRLFIHGEYCSSIIEKILLRQRNVMQEIKREVAQFGSSRKDNRIMLIMDDAMYDNRWTRDNLIRLLFMNGRHYSILVMVALQYCLGIPPALRSNIDYSVLLKDSSVRNRRILYENFAGCLGTFEAFAQIMDACTNNREVLVFHNSSLSNKLEDQMFYYRAQDHPNFRVGAEEYWRLSETLPANSGGEAYDPRKPGPKKQRLEISKSS
jgi:hypothetical protein